MVIDTTVFVDFLRGRKEAIQFLLHADEELVVSQMVFLELVSGLRRKSHINTLLNQLEALACDIVLIDKDISQVAAAIYCEHHHTHGLGIMDAYVAALAVTRADTLVTHNLKHYRFIPGLLLHEPYAA